MSRQLNLRVDEDFAGRLERLSRAMGRPMASVLEAISTPALEAAEDDLQFEAEALVAWDEYQLTGRQVSSQSLDALFDEALQNAVRVAEKQEK